MAITKKPNSNKKAIIQPNDERAVQAFISGTAKATEAVEDATKKPVMIRFDPKVLARVDAAAKRRGISRSAWIQFTVSRALDQGEG
jgi:predicted HicB family RNase H-like nuclease